MVTEACFVWRLEVIVSSPDIWIVHFGLGVGFWNGRTSMRVSKRKEAVARLASRPVVAHCFLWWCAMLVASVMRRHQWMCQCVAKTEGSALQVEIETEIVGMLKGQNLSGRSKGSVARPKSVISSSFFFWKGNTDLRVG